MIGPGNFRDLRGNIRAPSVSRVRPKLTSRAAGRQARQAGNFRCSVEFPRGYGCSPDPGVRRIESIDKLEEEVGQPLVSRTPPTRLTPAGVLLLSDIKRNSKPVSKNASAARTTH
mgnify:CR=1 FL=1